MINELIRDVLNQIPDKKKDADFYMQLYIDLYLEDFDMALGRLDEPKLYLYKMSKSVLKELIEGLKIDNINDEEYSYFKGLLEKILNGDLNNIEERELYNKMYYKITNSNIKSILNEIKLERYWDQGY